MLSVGGSDRNLHLKWGITADVHEWNEDTFSVDMEKNDQIRHQYEDKLDEFRVPMSLHDDDYIGEQTFSSVFHASEAAKLRAEYLVREMGLKFNEYIQPMNVRELSSRTVLSNRLPIVTVKKMITVRIENLEHVINIACVKVTVEVVDDKIEARSG